MRINHTRTTNIVCPWCGHKKTEPWEIFDIGDDYTKDLDCSIAARTLHADSLFKSLTQPKNGRIKPWGYI